MNTEEYGKSIADGLRWSATAAVLVGDHDARDLYQAIRSHIPIVAVVSRTGKTLLVGVLTEDVSQFSHNDRLNLKRHLEFVKQVGETEPARVWNWKRIS